MVEEPRPPGLLPAGLRGLSDAVKGGDTAELLSRLGFLVVGFILLQVAGSVTYHFPLFANAGVLAAVLVAYGLGLALILVALFAGIRLAPRAYLVVLAAVYAVVLEFGVNVLLESFYRTDSLAYTQYSASLLLQGRNPYAADMTPSLALYRVPIDAWTPLETGGIFDRSPYPALSFLVYVPGMILGLADVRYVYLAFHLAGLGILYARAPPEWRGFAPVGLVMTLDLVDFTGKGVPDILWVVPTILLAVDLRSAPRAGLWYGLACSFKQTPWILAPFLLLLYWHRGGETRVRQIGMFAGVSAGVFLVANGPFLLADAGAWAAAMFAPFTALQVPAGVGLSALTQYGFVPLTRTFYAVAELGTFAVLLFLYHVRFPRLEHALWVFPSVILFVSYRTLQSYLVYAAPFAVIGLWMWWEGHARPKDA